MKLNNSLFCLQMEDVGDTIEKLRIGHDGSGFGAGWHLEKVEVRKLQESGKVTCRHSLHSFLGVD